MEIGDVIERVRLLSNVDADVAAGPGALESALVTARELSGWVEARQASIITRLSETVSFPEAAIAGASKTSIGQASKVKDRSDTLVATPHLAGALGDGTITAGHIDAVTRSARQLAGSQRGALFDRVDALTDVAAAATVEQFSKRVRLEAKKIEAGDGLDRLERQLGATRLSAWVDIEGMWNLRGRFDPVTGVKLAAKLDGAVEALFTEATPQRCPSDPIEKQQFLSAHALARLLDGTGATGKTGRPEYLVVVDADAPGQTGPVADWSIPVDIPSRVLAELAGDADVSAVVIRNGVVLHATGELNLGRRTRLASRAQRRALRGLYSTCGIPGCSVGYDRCELHHVTWWRHGGRTDLANLIPICTKHHGRIHNDGWVIELGPHRQLTLTLPDGTVHNTGPPTIRAA